MSEARSINPPEEKPELTKYELREEIGHGGMATVYRALDRRLEREVAVKVIHRHLRESGEVAARFTSEARAVAKLRHPNIVEVFDVSDPGEPERYLVVELVRGTTLRKLLRVHGFMPAEIAAAVTLEIAAALEHAHQHGVVHRDVKPENVLVELPTHPVDRESQPELEENEVSRALVKITDFGIAKLLDAQGVTSTGQVLGSPAHMAPEQIEGDVVTARADVFALGVLMYESMVGALPFDGRNPAQVLRRVLEGRHPPADRARPSVGAGWSRILARALARDPADRYESAAAFAGAIRGELSVLGFDNARAKLREYLLDPPSYCAKYEPWAVDRLLELGREARARRDIPFAADCLNRALAFRPDDPELVHQVTSLARAERTRRTLVRAAILAAVGLVIAGAAVATAHWWPQMQGAGSETRGQARKPTGDGRAVGRPIPKPPAQPGASALTGGRPVASATHHAGSRRPHPREVVRPEPQERLVRVNITGAKGGKLSINGEPRAWFGTTQKLVVGQTYTFEFLPPPDQPDCCEGETKSVTILPGDDVLSVEGNIAFRDAVLSTGQVPRGGHASCGLFQLDAPGSQKVPMRQAELRIVCTVTTPDGANKKIPATLRPGKTTALDWPAP